MNSPVKTTPQPRKKFDKVFKQRAVELWLSSGKTAVQVGAELGVYPQRLSAWKVRLTPPPLKGDGGGGGKRTADQWETEYAALRRENDYLRQQRDILKKTLGILSEPPINAFNALTR